MVSIDSFFAAAKAATTPVGRVVAHKMTLSASSLFGLAAKWAGGAMGLASVPAVKTVAKDLNQLDPSLAFNLTAFGIACGVMIYVSGAVMQVGVSDYGAPEMGEFGRKLLPRLNPFKL
jgi:hypothetical protein